MNGSRGGWFVGDRTHREDRPTVTEYEDGKIVEEMWQLNDYFHCENGPAWIVYEGDWVICKQWFIDGKRLCKEDFTSLEMVNQMQAWELFEPHELMEME